MENTVICGHRWNLRTKTWSGPPWRHDFVRQLPWHMGRPKRRRQPKKTQHL